MARRWRGWLFLSACSVVFLMAVGLRARSYLQHAPSMPVLSQPPAMQDFPVPRDYVLHPEIVFTEAEHGPRRVISLAPSITETLCALGLLDRLVGRTQFCQYPPGLAAVPAVGGIMDTNLEMIRALEPDLVVTTRNSGGVGDKLTALGLRHTCLPHESLEDVFSAIEQAGAVCDRPGTARRLSTAIQADLDRLSSTAKTLHPRPLRVLLVLGELRVPPGSLWVAGPGSFLHTLLKLSGHKNVAEGVLRSSHGEIPLERLLLVDPDVILTFSDSPPKPDQMAELYRSWGQVGAIKAIRMQRVRTVGGLEWLSAGPRIALELHRFITVLSEFR